jgi:hypothetical protein
MQDNSFGVAAEVEVNVDQNIGRCMRATAEGSGVMMSIALTKPEWNEKTYSPNPAQAARR